MPSIVCNISHAPGEFPLELGDFLLVVLVGAVARGGQGPAARKMSILTLPVVKRDTTTKVFKEM